MKGTKQMTNQDLTLQNEMLETQLTSERQRAEIAELKNKLLVLQAKKASKLEDSLFSPALINHYKDVAQMLSKSEVVPKCYRGKPADVMVAMEMGYQLGFPVAQSLQDIAVINGRPSLWGDGLKALALNHPDCESIVEEPLYNGEQVIGYRCIVQRRGHAPHTKMFTIKDAETAGLWNKKGPWTQYPERMLQLRARSFAIRDMFADALRGIASADEMKDVSTPNNELNFIDGASSRVEPKEFDTQTDRLKSTIGMLHTEAKIAGDSVQDTQPAESEEPKKVLNDLIDEISQLMDEKDMDEERKKKAFEHYKISKLEELSHDQAKLFLLHMQRIQHVKI